MRFAFLIEPWLQPILLPFGAIPSNAYAELDGPSLHVRFGLLFDEKLPLNAIERVEKATWPIYQGLGHRIWFGGKMGVLGSTRNVVALHFKHPQQIRALLALYYPAKSFYLALEDPEGFLAAVEDRLD